MAYWLWGTRMRHFQSSQDTLFLEHIGEALAMILPRLLNQDELSRDLRCICLTLSQQYAQTQRRSEKTIEAYSRDLKQAVAFFGESADIQSLDTLSVIGWIRALSVKNIAGRSICRKLSALRGLFQEAVNQRLFRQIQL